MDKKNHNPYEICGGINHSMRKRCSPLWSYSFTACVLHAFLVLTGILIVRFDREIGESTEIIKFLISSTIFLNFIGIVIASGTPYWIMLRPLKSSSLIFRVAWFISTLILWIYELSLIWHLAS